MKWEWYDYVFATIVTLLSALVIVLITYAIVAPPPHATIHGIMGEAHCCVAKYQGYGRIDLHCENDTVVHSAANFFDTGKECL